MRAPVKSFLMIAAILAAGACGKEIGDKCVISSDCKQDGTRQCVLPELGGYCTIQGCDLGTCPQESTCVRFFTSSFSNRPCDPLTEDVTTDTCSLDEVCTLQGQCASSSAEIRYCMFTCESSGDCRDGYECRGYQENLDHGGEPLLAPGIPVDENSPKYCAPAAE